MRKRSSLTVVVLLGLLFIFAAAPKNRPRDIKGVKDISGVKPHIHHREFPLHFIANKGQVNEKAAYYARAAGYTLWLTKEGFVFDSVKKTEIKKKLPHSPHSPHSTHSPKTTRDVSRLIFVGAGKNPVLIPLEEAALKVNYFIGNDGSKWHTNVPTSMAVLYKGLYKNIDLKVYGIEKQIEYDWIVNPGGNPGDIRFQYKNVKGTRIDEKGNLLIETDSGELMHKKPVCYQRRGLIYQTRIEVTGRFKKTGENTYGFEVGDYDKRTELVIDPVVLAYSTYLGGGLNEQGRAIDVDGSGCVYVTGRTFSTNFPTQDPYQGALVGPAADVFVTKIDTTQGGGASLIYSTYLGGDSADLGHGIAVDAGGNAYVTGYTGGSDFPVTNQYQGDQGGDDVFLTKIAADGASLLYSTYLGGGSFEEGLDIAVDGSGNAYVTGFTNSTLFPTRNQNQANQTGLDAFVTKIDTTQSGDASLIYSTYLGGGDTDQGNRIAVDGSGNAYVTGSTLSTNFPTKSPYQSNQTGWDAFVTKIDTTQSGGASLIYSTYLGWDGLDEGFGIAVDGSGRAYVTGFTDSTDFPTLNPYQTNQTGTDVFVTKIAAGGSSLVYSTYLGGGNDDYSYGLAIDGSGNAYVTGYTTSTGFPILNQNQSDPADSNTDAFVTKIDTTQSGGASLIYSTYLGGGDGEEGRAIAVDAGGNAYVAGYTTSMNFPTANQYQGSNQGGEDVFVTTISAFPGPPTVDTPTSADITPTTATLGGNVSSINGANVTERGVYWSTTDGFTPPGQGTNVSETGDWGTGAFTVPVTGLPPGTTIYFRAYAVNSAGTGYSAQDSFPTPPLPPTVTTDAVTNITATTATCGGDVTLDGGAPVTSRGVCWSTSTGPTVALSTKTTDGSGTGSFTSSITGLTPATTYYVRAYAVNSAGTSYGNEVSFDTADNPSISGRIADGNSGVGAVTLTFSNGGGNTSSLSDGTYSHIVDYGWSGTVTPAKQGYTFEPPNQSYPNVVSAQTGQDYTATAITFEISGKVTTGGTNGTGVSDVILTFSNGGGSTATTAGGIYSHAVDYGWSGTVTPEKDGYTFDPVNKSYPNVVSAQTGQDYTAEVITLEISGKVTTGGTGGTGGTGVSGVILTFSNGGGSTATTAGGIYSHAVDYGWSGTVTPEKDGYTFDPVNKSYPNVVSAQTGQDYTAEVITLE
ncbi:MAG: hypothetical protein GY950_31760, partial [bacterium]|nr:hypothetical protein [bacterium]